MGSSSNAWLRWVSRPWGVKSRFALRLAIGMLLVLWPWAGLGHRFGALASDVVNASAGLVFSGPESLQMRPEGPKDSWNALLTLRNAEGTQRVLWELRRVPYLPTAVFAVLTLAFPLGSWKRRLAVLALGLVLLQVLPLLRLVLLISSDAPIRLLELPSWLQSALVVACGTLVFPPGMAYAVPALLWLLLLALVDRGALGLALRSASGSQALSEFTPPSPPSPKLRGNQRGKLPRKKRMHRKRSGRRRGKR